MVRKIIKFPDWLLVRGNQSDKQRKRQIFARPYCCWGWKSKSIDDDVNDNHPLVSTKLDSKVDLGLAASGHLIKGAQESRLFSDSWWYFYELRAGIKPTMLLPPARFTNCTAAVPTWMKNSKFYVSSFLAWLWSSTGVWWWSWWLWGSLLLTHPTAPGMDKNWIAWLDFCHKVKKLVGSQPHLVREVVTVDFNVYSSWPWQWGWWW